MTTEPIGDPPVEGPVANVIAAILQAVGLVLAGGPAAASAELEALRQDSFVKARGVLPDIGLSLEAFRREGVTAEELENVLARYGFSDRAQEVILSVVPALLDVASLLELNRRGTVEPGRFVSGLRALGYPDESIELLGGLTEALPPIQDVILWAVREVFTPDIRERFQLDQGFPEELLPFATQVGLSDDNARNYWAAHWQLPSVTLGFDMLHRSPETGIEESDLDLLLRAQDVMPFWREPIKAVAFRPFTRVDVRRMHKLGVLTEEQLVRAYQDLGYDEQRAGDLALFTVRLNEGETREAIEPFRAGLRTRIQSLFLRGAIGADDTAAALVELGHSEEEVAAFVSESELIREADESEDQRQAVRNLFVRGFWTEEQAMSRLLSLGFDADELARLFAVWELQRELREETAAERDERDLTKSDVLGAYRDDLIDEDTARAFLLDLGFDPAEAEVLTDRIDMQKGARERDRVERSLRTLFLARHRSASEVRTQLGEIGVSATRVEGLLLEWETDRDARAPELTTSQISRAFARGLIPREDAAGRLDGKGYMEPDRDILLALAAGPDEDDEEEPA